MDGWRNNRPFTGVKYIGIGALRPGREDGAGFLALALL